MIVKKRDFIWQMLKILEKDLTAKLPDEGFEYEMIAEANKILYDRVRHIGEAIE